MNAAETAAGSTQAQAARAAPGSTPGPKGKLHDTRVSAISNLADAGVPDTVARSISGDRTPSVHARYQITAESTQADALDKAEAAVAKLAKGNVGRVVEK